MIRKLKETDIDLLMQSFLPAFFRNQNSKKWMQQFNINNYEELINHMFSPDIEAVIIDETFVLFYMITCPWYLDCKYLQECLVIRINKNRIPFSNVIKAMEDIAYTEDCIGICVSTDMANDDALVRKYKQEGFTVEAVKLYKPIRKDYEGPKESSKNSS